MMKNYLAILFLPILAACSSEDNVSLNFEEQNVILTASLEQQETQATRTSLTSTNSVVWSSNDEISVLSYYNTKANNNKFTLETGASTTNATFKSLHLSSASKYYALYPYSSTASYDGTNITFSLPETQTRLAGSFGQGSNPAIAVFSNSEENLQFKNLCGVLSIYLSGSGNLESITLTSKKSGEYLWGDYTLAADNNIGTNSQTLTHTANGSNSITLNCGSGVTLTATAKEFDIVVPAGTLSEGFEAVCSFTGGETETISSTNEQTIVRSQKHIMTSKAVFASMYTNLENDVVKDYLDYMDANPYPDGNYTYTNVTDYMERSVSYDKRVPFPVNVTWTRNSSSTAQYLTVSENADFSNAYYDKEAISNTVSTYAIYNLIPGRKYYYKVTATVDDNEVELINSTFNTCGRRRMLYISGVGNVRDLGGQPVTISGRTRIKFGKLFRCAATNNVTATGRRQAHLAGIGAELDLRGDDESSNLTASPLCKDESYVVDYKRISSTSYASLASSTTDIDDVQWIITEEKAGKSVIEHCAGGLDRAGTLAFLIEGLLGVDENHQTMDFELSFVTSRTRSEYQAGMYTGICKTSGDPISGVTYPATVTTTWQRRFYNYFYNGYNGHKISQEDLNWFIDNMTE